MDVENIAVADISNVANGRQCRPSRLVVIKSINDASGRGAVVLSTGSERQQMAQIASLPVPVGKTDGRFSTPIPEVRSAKRPSPASLKRRPA